MRLRRCALALCRTAGEPQVPGPRADRESKARRNQVRWSPARGAASPVCPPSPAMRGSTQRRDASRDSRCRLGCCLYRARTARVFPAARQSRKALRASCCYQRECAVRLPTTTCGMLSPIEGSAVDLAAAVRSPAVSGARSAGRCGAAGGNNVETLHPVETLHVYRVFYFHWTKSFHAKQRPGPDRRAATRRAALNVITPPLSHRRCPQRGPRYPVSSTAFWRKAIDYPFQEHEQGAETVQSFTAGL